MSQPFDLTAKIQELRAVKTDTQDCEVKESVGKIPNTLTDTLSAFANGSGGWVILGLSGKNGFRPAKGFDAETIFKRLQTIGDLMTPVLRPEIFIFPFEDAQVIVMRILPVALNQRPCFVTAQGPYMGSFIRSGDGDRRLTAYEVDRLQEARQQPRYDVEPIPEATLADLHTETLDAIVARVKEMNPRVLGKMQRDEILQRLGAVAWVGNRLCPTLGGLLAAGIFPQQFFPRLNVTFTVYPGPTKAQDPNDPMRYLDTVQLDGSIPEILLSARDFLKKNMRTGALIDGALRKDVTDYPLVAFREALVNALQHRDYSPEGRASQVQINLYSDSLEILNPGGLYGAASLDETVTGISATRNTSLSRLLEHTPFTDDNGRQGFVIENRGTGIIQIRRSLTQSLMPPPILRNSPAAFSITMLRRRMTNSEKHPLHREQLAEGILQMLRNCPSASITELAQHSGANRRTIATILNDLIAKDAVERTEPLKSPKQRFRIKN